MHFIILLIALIIPKSSIQGKNPKAEFITSLITEIKLKPKTNPGKSIWQYRYRGKTVYFVPPVCCDVPSYLYDENGKLICMPNGGFTGVGDGKCSDFIKQKRNGKLIWKDDRP